MKPISWFGTPLVRPTIGYHMIAPNLYQDIQQAVIEARPSALKIVGDGQEFAMFQSYYNALKDYTVFLARPYAPGEAIGHAYNTGQSPEQAALDWHKSVSYVIPYLPDAYWGGWNEPPPGCEDWLDRCDAERVRLAALCGYRVSCLEWSEGTPSVMPWDAKNSYNHMRRTLEAINTHGPYTAILGPHEYLMNATDMLSQPYRIGRINYALEWMRSQGWHNIFVVISEYGIDPWKSLMNAEQMAEQMIREDVHDYYDEHVVGRTIFSLDHHPGWKPADIYGNCFKIINQYLIDNRPDYVPPIPDTPGAPIPVPPEPDPPTTEEPEKVPIRISHQSPGCNMRSEAKKASELLGYAAPGSEFEVEYPSVTGYVKIPSLNCWILEKNVERI